MNYKSFLLICSCFLPLADNQSSCFSPSKVYSRQYRDELVQSTLDNLKSTSYYSLPNNKHIIHYDPSGSNSDDQGRKVQASDLKKNTINSVDQCYGIKIDTFDSTGWRGRNAIGRVMRVKIENIYQITGIYSHFGSYFDHSILESGSAQEAFESAGSYTDTYANSCSFDYQIDEHTEEGIQAKLDIDAASLSTNSNVKSGATFNFNCTYTRNSVESFKWSSRFSLGKEAADYCPDGYGLSSAEKGPIMK